MKDGVYLVGYMDIWFFEYLDGCVLIDIQMCYLWGDFGNQLYCGGVGIDYCYLFVGEIYFVVLVCGVYVFVLKIFDFFDIWYFW